MGWPCSICSTTVFSLPFSFLVTRCPKTSAILLAVMRHMPISQPRSKILWMGKLRLKMKLRQYSILLTGKERPRFIAARSRLENFGPSISVQYSSCLRMTSDLKRSAAAWQASRSATGPAALAVGKLRPQYKRPVLELLADDFGREAIRSSLQCLRVGDGQEGVVVLAEADLLAVELLFD